MSKGFASENRRSALVRTIIFVVGVVLIGVAVGLHFQQVNVTTVASLGSVGGLVILFSLGLSISHFKWLRGQSASFRTTKEDNDKLILYGHLVNWTREGDLEAIQTALKDYTTIPLPPLLLNFEPLALAAYLGHVDMVRFFLNKGIQPSKSSTDLPLINRGDALSAAIASSNPRSLECLKVICAHAPDRVSLKNHAHADIETPLAQARYFLHLQKTESDRKKRLEEKIAYLQAGKF